jgi:hypothetical protein
MDRGVDAIECRDSGRSFAVATVRPGMTAIAPTMPVDGAPTAYTSGAPFRSKEVDFLADASWPESSRTSNARLTLPTS